MADGDVDLSYGCSIDDVQALLPTRPIRVSPPERQGPSVAQVEGFIQQVGGRVFAVAGNLARFNPDVATRAGVAAQGLVALGAAAYADDAGSPETSQPGSTNYGSRLWERFESGLESFGLRIKVWEDEGAVVDPTVGARPAGVFAPPPRFPSTLRF